MNNIMATIPELINLPKRAKSSFRKEERHVMLVDSSTFKNKKKKKSTRAEGGGDQKKPKETALKETCFYYGQVRH